MGQKGLSVHGTAKVIVGEVRGDTHCVSSHSFWLGKRKNLLSRTNFFKEPPDPDLYHRQPTLHRIWLRCAPHRPGRLLVCVLRSLVSPLNPVNGQPSRPTGNVVAGDNEKRKLFEHGRQSLDDDLAMEVMLCN